MLTHPFPHAFGIDIGDRSVKLVQLRNREKIRSTTFQPVAMRMCPLEPGLVVNGIIEQPELVRKKIEKLLKGERRGEHPIKSPWVVASVPENHSFLKLISIPKSDMSATDSPDVLNLISTYLPVDDLTTYSVDWHVVQPEYNDTEVRILVGAIPKRIGDSYTYLLESLGLGVMALEIEEVAIARSMVTAHKEYKEEARAIIDIGSTRTQVIIYDRDVIQFSTVLPFSGELLTHAIMDSQKVDEATAEKIKKDTGLEIPSGKKNTPALLKLVQEFSKALEHTFSSYYGHNTNANRITRIVLCGGSCNLLHLDTVLSEALSVECVRGNVWKNLGIDPKHAPMENDLALSYATAIGLALRAADNPFTTRDTI
ncbi:MAG TPA: pilus assembly protein PilM [Candidatus Magasanikbacteria bacterium]|nr:pilus assembly protein PilM [Candidatus Magasanikbacteria bacterium]